MRSWRVWRVPYTVTTTFRERNMGLRLACRKVQLVCRKLTQHLFSAPIPQANQSAACKTISLLADESDFDAAELRPIALLNQNFPDCTHLSSRSKLAP
jgi:hypothetical protein